MRQHFSRVKDKVSLSRSSGETLVVRSTKSLFTNIKERRFRPLGDQLVQLDRSRSRTCTEPAAPIFLYSCCRSKRLPVTTLAMDEFRPAAADHIHIFRIKLHRAVDAVCLLASDQRAARAAKQIQHGLARFRRVENRLDRSRPLSKS